VLAPLLLIAASAFPALTHQRVVHLIERMYAQPGFGAPKRLVSHIHVSRLPLVGETREEEDDPSSPRIPGISRCPTRT
jgi:hypothetical protein